MDESELKRLLRTSKVQDLLLELAIRDPLAYLEHTGGLVDAQLGLLSKKAMEEILLPRLVNRAEETAQSQDPFFFSYAVLDVDNFKEINTRLGYASGDRVIFHLASIVKVDTRYHQKISSAYRAEKEQRAHPESVDMLAARVGGGDELGIIFPWCNREQGCSVAERIRRDFQESAPFQESPDERFTLTGVVTQYVPGLTVAQLINGPKEVLRQKVKLGKNIVVEYSPIPGHSTR